MLEYIAKAMLAIEERKNHFGSDGRELKSRAYYFNEGLVAAQNILLEVYDLFAPKKLSETHYLLDNDLEYD